MPNSLLPHNRVKGAEGDPEKPLNCNNETNKGDCNAERDNKKNKSVHPLGDSNNNHTVGIQHTTRMLKKASW